MTTRLAADTPVAPAPPTLSPRRQWAALAVLVLPIMIIAIDNTVLGFAVPHLSEDLGPSSTQLLWIVDIYGFVLAALLVTMGNLGDRIGRRRLLLGGAMAFGLGSLAAAFSTSAPMLIAARAFLGVAGATLMPSTLSLIRNIIDDPHRRRLAIGIWTAGFSVGAALGPIMGGWLLEHFWWGSVFLVNLPVMALLLLLGRRLLPESRHPSPGRFDLASSALSLAAILPFIYAVKQLAVDGPALDLAGLAALGVAMGVVFLRRQRRLTEPMVDVSLFRHRTFSVAIGSNLVISASVVGSLFFVAQYLQSVLGLGPLAAGFHLVPGMIAAMLTSVGVVPLFRRGIPVSVLLAGALAVAAGGFLVMLGLGTEGGGPQMIIANVLLGGGGGAAASLGTNLVMAAVPAKRAGAGSAVSETAFELGAALGTAVLGSALTAVYRRRLELPTVLSAEARQGARETIGEASQAMAELPARVGSDVLDAAQSAFTQGVHAAALLGALIAGLAAVAAASLLRGIGASPAAADDNSGHERHVDHAVPDRGSPARAG